MRYQNWEARLDAFLADAAERRFAWGRHDCALFACDAALAMTGRDHAAAYRGLYRSGHGAVRMLRNVGAGDLKTTIEKTLGRPYTSPRLAGRGDAALVKTENGPALGIVDLTGRFVALPGAEGLVRLPLSSALFAWEI